MRELLFRGFHPCDGPETIGEMEVIGTVFDEVAQHDN